MKRRHSEFTRGDVGDNHDIFISYRRDSGAHMASLIFERLRGEGYRVFLDLRELRGGKFNDNLYRKIDQCTDFILVLAPGSLDRCRNEDDWLRLEIARAINANKNIVPVMTSGFEMPSRDSLDKDIRDVAEYNALMVSPEFFDAFADKLMRFMRCRSPLHRRKALLKKLVLLGGGLLVCALGTLTQGQGLLTAMLSYEDGGNVNQPVTPPPPPQPPSLEELARKPGDTATFAGIEMVWCPPGEFMMGSPLESSEAAKRFGSAEKGYKDAMPVHKVRFTRGFWMGKYEVTKEQYETFVKAMDRRMGKKKREKARAASGKSKETKNRTWQNPGNWLPQANEPVVCVSWTDAQEYITWLNSQEGGGGFGLPSEAQWEYACRAGTQTEYFWGDEPAGGKEFVNAAGTDQDSSGEHFEFNDGYITVAPVGSFKANPWGLFDIHGNVWEWCQDWYHVDYENAPPDGTAWINPPGTRRVFRGGSWDSQPGLCRVATRNFDAPDDRNEFRGFRLMRTP